MTIRARLFLGAALLALLPLGATGLAIRHDVGRRLERQVRARADALVANATRTLDSRRKQLDGRLASLVAAARADDRLRLALLEGGDAAYVREWAPRAQELTGLDALLLVDERGEILSSGQFRNDFGRVDADTPAFLARCGDAAGVVSLRRPDGEFLALARQDSLALSGRPYRLIGGIALSPAMLSELVPDPEVTATLWVGDRALLVSAPADGPPDVERVLELPARVPDAPAAETARIAFGHSLAGRRDVLRALDRRLLLAFGLAAAAALALARVLAARIARPVEQLAAKTREVDLDRLDVDFATDRADEIGALSRFLDGMTHRLRASVGRLRDAERRATLGELARQVNHDLKNAFPPIRNVVKHLSEVAHEPAELARVFAERCRTLDSGLSYLDELSANWRRLAARPESTICDLAAIARDASAGRTTAAGRPVRVDASAGAAHVHANATGLRRIVDNLVTNACESGASDVAVIVRHDVGPPHSVRLIVEDDGPGLPAEARERVFEPYWTTKAGGTGLGLAIVRRLVSDSEGTVRIDDRDGRGTRVTVTLPAGGAA